MNFSVLSSSRTWDICCSIHPFLLGPLLGLCPEFGHIAPEHPASPWQSRVIERTIPGGTLVKQMGQTRVPSRYTPRRAPPPLRYCGSGWCFGPRAHDAGVVQHFPLERHVPEPHSNRTVRPPRVLCRRRDGFSTRRGSRSPTSSRCGCRCLEFCLFSFAADELKTIIYKFSLCRHNCLCLGGSNVFANLIRPYNGATGAFGRAE